MSISKVSTSILGLERRCALFYSQIADIQAYIYSDPQKVCSCAPPVGLSA